jgi:hypothetical protein
LIFSAVSLFLIPQWWSSNLGWKKEEEKKPLEGRSKPES